MTVGDLLRQDGAIALLVIGAALGFLAGMFFRGRVKGKELRIPQAAHNEPAPPCAPAPVKTAAVIAAIAAAVNKYQSETCN